MTKTKTYRGGERVNPGFYLCPASGEVVQQPASPTVLPGDSDVRYDWVPVPLVLPVALLTAFGFVIFLPLVGIVGLSAIIARGIFRMIFRVARWTATTVRISSLIPRSRTAQSEEPETTENSEALREEITRFLRDRERDENERTS